MKRRIRSALAALAFAGFFLVLSPSLFKECGIPWFNWDCVTGPNNFYFTKRIWLADARTLVAAVRFLYEFNNPPAAIPAEVADVPRPLPPRPIQTNFHGAIVPAAS